MTGTKVYAEGKYKLGDAVKFAGHEWYIIGTKTEGVRAPEGCYTLFAKNNDFGKTQFREGVYGKNESDAYYKDSKLQKKMEEIANNFSKDDRSNIVPRNLTVKNDEIIGSNVDNQYVWALSKSEATLVKGLNSKYIHSWSDAYWTRTRVYSYGKYHHIFVSALGDTFDDENGDSPEHINSVFPALYVRASALPKIVIGDY